MKRIDYIKNLTVEEMAHFLERFSMNQIKEEQCLYCKKANGDRCPTGELEEECIYNTEIDIVQWLEREDKEIKNALGIR